MIKIARRKLFPKLYYMIQNQKHMIQKTFQ